MRTTLKILGGIALILVVFVFVARKTISTVTVSRTLNAPVETVWAVWNDPEQMKQWWGPTGYSAPVIKNDLRVDGRFLLSMKSPSGDIAWNAGVYEVVELHQKIVSKMWFADEKGDPIPGKDVPVPGEWPDTTRITVEFKRDGAKTGVTITEEGIPTIMKLFAKMGWDQQFDKLDKLLAH